MRKVTKNIVGVLSLGVLATSWSLGQAAESGLTISNTAAPQPSDSASPAASNSPTPAASSSASPTASTPAPAATKTAAADKSLIILICSFFSVEIKLQRYSIAVLINSKEKTKPIANNSAIHSVLDTSK